MRTAWTKEILELWIVVGEASGRRGGQRGLFQEKEGLWFPGQCKTKHLSGQTSQSKTKRHIDTGLAVGRPVYRGGTGLPRSSAGRGGQGRSYL